MADSKFDAATASLTWDEIVWIVKRLSGKKTAAAEGRKFLELTNLKILNVDEGVLHKAQDLIEKYNLKPRDAIHAAAAINNNIVDIVTYDPDFDVVKELKSGTPEK